MKIHVPLSLKNKGINKRLTQGQIARRNINNLRYVDDTTLMVKSNKELKILLRSVKEESEKAGLKLNIEKLRSWHPVHHFMANRGGKKWKQ